MAEITSLRQIAQIGLESTLGTGVTPTRRLASFELEPAIKPSIKTYKPMGHLFATTSAMGKEMAEHDFKGPATYDELAYLYASNFANTTPTTPTGGTLSRQWVFSMSTIATNTPAPYSLEIGSPERAGKYSGAVVDSTTITFGREEVPVQGKITSMRVTDGVTLTSSLPTIDLIPIVGNQPAVYLADSHTGLDSATKLTRAFRAVIAITDRWAPVWPLDPDYTSYATVVEHKQMKTSVKLLVAADATGMALLDTMRTNAAKFIRVAATGPVIEGSIHYSCQFDICGRVANVSKYEDQDGIWALEWEFEIAEDATWGKGVELTLVNTLASL